METVIRTFFMIFISLICFYMCNTQRVEISLTDEALEIRDKFFTDLGQGSLDLVILMERTRAIDRDFFYFHMRKLVNHTLRYYANINPSNVRLALVTFARNPTVHVDGLSNDLYKCELWEGMEKYWDNVLLNATEEEWDYGDLSKAYGKVLEIFQGSRSGNTKKYLWLLGSGDFKERLGDPSQNRDMLEAMNVTIFGVITGHWVHDGLFKMKYFLSSGNHLMGNVTLMTKYLIDVQTVKPITGNAPYIVPIISDQQPGEYCYCDVITGFVRCDLQVCPDLPTCNTGESCVFRTQFSSNYTWCGSEAFFDCQRERVCAVCINDGVKRAPCTCSWYSGMTGPNCTVEENECVPDACSNNGTCVQGQGIYSCLCPEGYEGTFCKTKVIPTTTTTSTTTTTTPGKTTMATSAVDSGAQLLERWKIIAIGVASGIFLIMLLVLVICCLCWCWDRKNKSLEKSTRVRKHETGTGPETADAEVYTNPAHIAQGTVTPDILVNSHSQQTSPNTGNFVRNASIKLVEQFKRIPTARVSPFKKPPPPPPKPNGKFDELYGNQGQVMGVLPTYQAMDDMGKQDYENASNIIVEGMKDWEPTVRGKLVTGSGLEHLTIVHKKRSCYITSAFQYLPAQEELDALLTLLQTKALDMSITIKQSRFNITKNDSYILESYEKGNNHGILCAGKSRRFVVIGYNSNAHMLSQCRNEVTDVVQHLINVQT